MRQLRRFNHLSLAGLLMLLLVPTIARAQASDLAEQDLRQRVLDLEKKVARLEAERAAAAKPNGAAADGNENSRIERIEGRLHKVDEWIAAQHAHDNSIEPPRVNAGPMGFAIGSADGGFNLRVRGYLQADGRWYTTGSKPPSGSTFLLKRVRPVFEGTVFKYFDYKLMPDFGQGAATIQDAYLDARYYQPLRLMAGKFKGPLDFERLVSARDMDLVERALTINLVPNRVMGFQLHGNVLDGRLEYGLGLVNGIPDQNAGTDISSNDSKEFIGRAFAWPFKTIGVEHLQGLGFGIGGSVGNQRGALPRYLTTGQNTFFTYRTGITAAGQRCRFEPQVYYHYGPLGLLGEFVQNTESVTSPQTATGGKVIPAISNPISNQAWQLESTYLVTGEEATYLGVKPKRRFVPQRGGWGAFELVARVSSLSVDRNAFTLGFADPKVSSREANEWAVGFNWYLNQNVKFMCDYARTNFVGGSPLPGHNRQDESTILTRVQVAF